MVRKLRTATIKKHLQLQADAKLRFTQRDRAFLADLAKVRLVSQEDAQHYHFQGNLDSCKLRLKKLVSIGLLKERTIIQPDQGVVKAYEFSSECIARKYGGRVSSIGSRRSDVHELLVSKSYFALDRPETFKLGSQMTAQEQALYMGTEGIVPDAYFTQENSQVVFVEADAGHYTKQQVLQKQRKWLGIQQFWAQPHKANCVIPKSKDVICVRF